MRYRLRTLLIPLFTAALAVVFALAAAAQSEPPKRSPLGIGPAPVAGAATGHAAQPAAPGWWGQVIAMQQTFVRDMGKQIRGLKSADPMAAAFALAGLSFLYGVLHAAGPGHGKAVISSYVLANRDTMRRAIGLSFLAAFFQACAAILFVGILAIILATTMTQMKLAEAWIERASWLFVIAVGGWLLWRQVRPMLAARPADHAHDHHAHGHSHHAPHAAARHVNADGSVCTHDHHSGDGHDHAHGSHGHGSQGHGSQGAVKHGRASTAACTHAHDPGHVHGPDCGHAHMPSPQDVAGPWSWRRALAISLGIGMRPCTGAILVMIFALSQGLLWAGVFATFMMSLGTAITVSLLAILAVTSRDLALRLTGGAESRWGQRLAAGVGIAAALLVIGLGVAGLAYPTPEPMFTTR